MRILGLLAALAVIAPADVRNCACDPANAESLAARECGLCRVAEQQPPAPGVFFLKDNNPRKANRWLALTRLHREGAQPLAEMKPAERVALWTAAIAKGKELWGDQWGLAINGAESRTQCHAHVHIGKLLDGIETANFVVVKGPAEIPVPKEGGGMWIHQDGGKLHVHVGEQITETVLLR